MYVQTCNTPRCHGCRTGFAGLADAGDAAKLAGVTVMIGLVAFTGLWLFASAAGLSREHDLHSSRSRRRR